MPYIPVGSLFFAPMNPDDYGSFVSVSGVSLAPPVNPLFDTDTFGTVTRGLVQLDGGTYCVTNLGNWKVGTFTAALAPLADDGGTDDPYSIGSNYTSHFYGIRNYFGSNPMNVGKWDTSATRVATFSLGINADLAVYILGMASDTLCYYAKSSGGAEVVKKVVFSGPTTTTFATEAGAWPMSSTGLLVLRSGELLVAWSSGVVKHYDTAGSVLHTYTRSGMVAMSSGLSDSSFWVSYIDGGAYKAREIAVSTGAVLHDFALPVTGFNWGGPFTPVRLAIGTPVGPGTPPDPTLSNSVPCCGTDATTGPHAGDVLQGFGWIPRCLGGGVVPSAPALTDSENWDV